MSTTTKNVGRVSIVPKGDWNINNTYIRLDLVTYDGNSYIAKKDVPKNIQLSNNNYWMLMASKGGQGEQGEQGAPFAIMKSYASIAAMNADFSNTDVQNGQFVIIDTGNVQDPDNAKLYYKGSNNYVFVTDMSGAAGIQGPRGTSAYEQAVAGGYEGTEAQFNEDLADFKELSEQAALSATAADNSAKDAEAYAIGKRGGIDVESTDPTYHNNAKYYSEQAALIVDDVEQVTTATTVGPADIATFNASAAGMPFKGLMANIEPVQDFNGYSRPWLGGAGKNQLSLSMSFLYEKNTNGTWTNNSYVSNGVTFVVQLNSNNDVIGINVNGTASANTDFVFITRAPMPEYPMIENGCPTGGSDNKYKITTRMFTSDFSFVEDYYDYGPGLTLSDNDHFEFFSSWITIYSGYTASNLVFRPMIRFQFDEDETFEPYSNICSITGWTGCKLHHTGVSLIGGDAFVGNAFAKTANGYELSYNGSGIANRGSGFADISGIPAGRYVLQFLNCSYTEGIEVAFRRRTNGTLTSIGTIIGSSTSGARAFDIPANTTELQFYIVPNSTVAIGTKVTMNDAILYRNGETVEPYKGNTYDITFPSPNPGTVYGGTLDVINKKLTVTKKYALLNDPNKWSETGINGFQYSDQFSDRKRYQTFLEGFLCSCANTSSNRGLRAQWISNTDYFGFSSFLYSNDNVLDKIKTAAANNKIAILYDLAEPLVYDITTEQVATLLGENNIWANRGDVTVTYGAYLETIKTYADRSADNAAAAEDAQEAAEAAQEAAEAALASIPADYTELSGDVDDLKSDVTLYTGNGEIVFTDGYYINTGGNTVDITAPTSSTTGYKYAIVPCSEGEKFTVTSSGGQTPRAYCFINDSESQTAATVVGRRAGAGEPVTDVVITAPANATKLVINAKSTEKSYYGVILKNRVDDLDDKLNDPVTGLATKINDSLTVDIEPVQEGEGDPSPENVRPITGWTGCRVFYPGLDITRDLHIVKNKYINASGVETKSITTDLSHTVYFPVTPGTALYFSSYWDELPGSAPSIAFYDASKTFKTRQYLLPNENQYKGHIGYNFMARTVPSGSYFAILNFNYGVRDRIVLADDDPVITFPSPDPDTVYGGVLSCSNGKWTLSVDHYVFTVTGNNITSRTILGNNLRTNIMSVNSNALTTGRNALAIANWLPRVAANYDRDVMGFYFDNEARFYVKAPISAVGDTLESVKTYFDENPLVIVYPLATPIVYDLSDAPEITTLLDTNSIWANTGDVTVTYGTYLEMIKDHADQVGDNILNAIAPLETTYTASQNYTVGSYIFVGTKFYKVTADIAEGGTITPNVNVIQTTVGEQSISVLRDLPQNPYKHIAKNKIADNDYEWSSRVKDIKSTCHLHTYQGLYFTRARLAGYDHIAISNYHASKPTVPIADVIKTLNNYDASRDDVPDTWLESPNAEHAYFTDANSYVGSPAGTHLHLCSVGSYVTSGSDNTGAGAGGFEGTVLDFAKAFEEMRQYPNGGGITINHPVWSGIDKDGILNLLLKVPNIFGMEIYNASGEHSGTGYALDLWDEVLATGNQIFGTAVPDHEVENSVWNNHFPLGFVHLLCITKTDQEIMLAYRNGRFYTTVENDTLLLKFFGIDNNGLVTFKATDTGTIKFVTAKRSVSVENNNIATFQTNSDDVYVRAEIETETNRLFTNAIIL